MTSTTQDTSPLKKNKRPALNVEREKEKGKGKGWQYPWQQQQPQEELSQGGKGDRGKPWRRNSRKPPQKSK